MDTLRISSTGFGLNYLPHGYAELTGLFEANGVKVEINPRPVWTDVLADLDAGDADLVLGGLWVPAMLAGTGRDYVVIGQVNARFPMAIVTREPIDDFELSWLSGRIVLVPGVGGTAPYEFTAGLMREAGVRPGDTRFVRDLSTELLVDLYEGGLGDAMVADLATTTGLAHRGHGVLSFQHAEVSGPMPNSVYYTRRDRLEELRPAAVAFLTAIHQGMAAVTASTVAELEPVLAARWPDLHPDVRAAATRTLIGNGTWEGVRIDEAGCTRWTSMLDDAGLIAHPAPFASLVDTAVADAAIR
jgi:NitT/TauT family transport system substrate-binding protein